MKAHVVFVFLVPVFLGLGNAESTLKKLQIIFRHGFRNPIRSAWNGTDTCALKYNTTSLGNLTELGRSQMTMLGYFLRMHYNALVGKDPSTVQMNSSINYRDFESAKMVSIGLFDQFGSSNVSVTLLNGTLDGPLIINNTYYENWYRNLPFKNDYQELCDSLQKSGSANCTDFFNLKNIADQFRSEVADGCQLPAWLNKDVQKQLKSLDEMEYNYYTTCANMDIVKENTDLMLQHINEVFKPGKDNTYKNVTFYAAHDTNIALISTRLGMFNKLPVPFGSYLAFEQHLVNNVPVVRVFYNNQSDYSRLHQLKIPNCDWDCPYDTFVKISKEDYKCSLGIDTRPMLILVILFSVLSLAKNSAYL